MHGMKTYTKHSALFKAPTYLHVGCFSQSYSDFQESRHLWKTLSVFLGEDDEQIVKEVWGLHSVYTGSIGKASWIYTGCQPPGVNLRR